MIHGSMERLREYLEAVPGAVVIEEFLTACYEDGVEPGKYELSGDEVFVSVEEYETVEEADKRWEAHERYFDIQCIISGRERIGFGSYADMEPVTEYDPVSDIAFYSGEGVFQLMEKGDFMILAPGETHKPCVSAEPGKAVKVKKAVVKIDRELFETK